MKEIIVNGYALDSEQLKPATENEKYSLIIAGAGSGKTLTLIGKIKYLIENKIYKPEEICCISFTNEATDNLKNNIIKNCNTEVPTYTFHKLALKILEIVSYNFKISSSNLLDETINEFFLSKCFGNINLQNIIYKKFSKFSFKNEKTWNKILSKKDLITYKKTIKTFINLMQSNGYDKSSFNNFFNNKKLKNTLIIIYCIYIIYSTEKESSNIIDFDDMIILSTKIMKEQNVNLPFKLIIIDEFQDTSLARFNLIREIIKKNNASLCVVGDDFQSIYHFSGCDLDLFLNFKKYYKDAKIYKLEQTYRNSQELIDIGGHFITKNPYQVKKKLVSPKHLSNPIKIIYFNDINKVLIKILNDVADNKEILIISRNNFDLKKYTKSLNITYLENNYISIKEFKDKKIRFMSIHKSKGLESDVVILLNAIDDTLGFPCKLKDEKVINLVKNSLTYPYEEERRLFYVALTRTKSYIYILTFRNNESIFISEIKRGKNVTKLHF